ncbi:MAG: FMN-dependent NADH-azoreductase [Rubrimonas sp.]
MSVLLIQSSARGDESVTRRLAADVAARLGGPVTVRDVSAGLPMVDAEWLAAAGADPAARSDAQRAKLALSDELIAELRNAETVVIAAPIYNFAVPAALKAWIDLVARARETFRYTEAGPEGLLKGRKAVIVAASGGVGFGSEADFATGYLRHMLGFMGITDVTVVGAEKLLLDPKAMAKAEAATAKLAA